MKVKKKLFFTGLMLFAMVIFFEITLQVASFISPKVNSTLTGKAVSTVLPYIEDPELSKRPNPKYPGHDKLGFRNPFVPEDITILVLGDSQTYGVGVKQNETWPAWLSKIGNYSTYNMAFSGYGICQSLVLLKEARTMKPRLIIATIYAGNDLYDAYSFIYYSGKLSALKSKDEAVLKAISQTESKILLHDEIEKVQKHKRGRGEIKAFLKDHSRLYGFMGAVRSVINKNDLDHRWEAILRLARKNRLDIFENDNFRTVFTPRYRLFGLQLDDPRIAEGMRIMFDAIRSMKQQCVEDNLPLLMVLIPTKELVFKEVAMQGMHDLSSDYSRLIENEETFWRMAKTFLETEAIYYVDSLSILRDCLRQGKQPYKMSQDGHPNAIGHKGIAETVLRSIEEHKFF